MPQEKEDLYWGATDKELVRLRGVLEYVGWVLCGGHKPNNTVPNVQFASGNNQPVETWTGFHGGVTVTNVYPSSRVQRPRDRDFYAQRHRQWQIYQERERVRQRAAAIEQAQRQVAAYAESAAATALRYSIIGWV